MAEHNDTTSGRVSATDSVNREIFSIHRNFIGGLVFFGDIVVAVGAPVALWNYGSRPALISWAVLIIITSYAWELIQRRYPEMSKDNERLRDRWGWLSSLTWAALPWLMIDTIDDGMVAWVLVFVITFAIGTDLLFLSQTDAPSLDVMVLVYGGSYVAAFAIELQLLPIGAVIIAGSSFIVASAAWSQVASELVDKRVESEERRRTDDLTGLATRTAATEAVNRLLAEGAAQIHCAFVDIDDFKHLNDNHGYAVGDAVLKAVGQLLRDHVADGWTVARFGGDEFVAVGAEPVDFHQLIEAEIRLPENGDLTISQSLSIGLSTADGGRASVNDLFREAASALRFAKRLGKHQVLEMTDELRLLEASNVSIGGRAGAALEAGEIVPWAQTIVDLETEEPVGLELLARWEQPDSSMIPPEVFVPIIENQGRGPTLGLQMINHAIEALASPSLRHRSTFITVNVSARHLYHRRLPAEILALLGRHNVDAQRLVLEITESDLLPSSPIWRETAHQLRTLGLGIAMDDFGTGYSSMQQLLEIPFTHVKVDRIITQSISRPGASDLASAVGSMASGAGMVAIVEGIETREQLDSLRPSSCRLGQGYLFHRPAPLAEVLANEIVRTRIPSESESHQRSA